MNSLLACEILDGADCCQFLLQGDDFKGQVTGRQDQDTHSGGTAEKNVAATFLILLYKVLKCLEMAWVWVVQGRGGAICIDLNKWLIETDWWDSQKQVDDQQGGDGHWLHTAAVNRYLWAWKQQKKNKSLNFTRDVAVKQQMFLLYQCCVHVAACCRSFACEPGSSLCAEGPEFLEQPCCASASVHPDTERRGNLYGRGDSQSGESFTLQLCILKVTNWAQLPFPKTHSYGI